MAAPYDSLESVVTAARNRLLDTIPSLAGEIMTDTQPFTIQSVNNGWRKMQEFLSKLGFRRFQRRMNLSGLSVVNPGDPSNLTYLDWSGYFNGTALQAGLALPSDFIAPKEIYERITGSIGNFFQMDDMSKQGLPLVQKATWNNSWQWLNEQILMPGALSTIDLNILYWCFAADFVAAGTTPFASQPVPIVRCQDAFANYICAEVAAPRGDMDAQAFVTAGEDAARILVSRENPGVVTLAPTPVMAPQIGGPQ